MSQTDEPINASTQPAEPAVRRFWWLKRLSLAGITLLVLLAITWIVWDQYSRRELQARVDAYRKAGEATTAEEIQPPTVPDEQNAAALYTQAGSVVNTKVYCPSASSYTFGEDLPYPPEWHTLARRAIEVNPKPLELARQASLRQGADWGIRIRSRMPNQSFPNFNAQRNLANLLGDAAVYEHFHGDDARAISDIRTLLHQARTLNQYPFVLSKLVGIGIEALAVARLEVIAGDLRIGSGPSTSNPSTEVSQDEVHALIGELLGGQQIAQFMAQAMRDERIAMVDNVQSYVGSSLLLKPAFRLDAARSLDRYTETARACLLPTLPAAKAALSPLSLIERQVRNEPRPVSPWSSGGNSPAPPIHPVLQTRRLLNFSSGNKLLDTLYRSICEQRMAAVMLAFRLYVIDHGQYPQTLQDLVPQYLSTLPADPMSADGRPFGYFIAANGKRPILYSVGDDGADQTQGRQAQIAAHILKGWQSTHRMPADDQYRDLSSWVNPAPRAPMTDKLTDEELGLKANPDDPKQPHAPRENPPGDNQTDEARQAK